jgi:hypothetical protein
MIISSGEQSNSDKDKNFRPNANDMAEQMFIFGVTTGMFVLLVGIVFAARARRHSQGYTSSAVEAHSSADSNNSSSHGEQ